MYDLPLYANYSASGMDIVDELLADEAPHNNYAMI